MSDEVQPYPLEIGETPEEHSRLAEGVDQADPWLDDLIRQNRVALHKAFAHLLRRKDLQISEIIEGKKLARRAK